MREREPNIPAAVAAVFDRALVIDPLRRFFEDALGRDQRPRLRCNPVLGLLAVRPLRQHRGWSLDSSVTAGDVILARQVSTQPEKILDFFDQLTRRCAQREEPFIAVVEF